MASLHSVRAHLALVENAVSCLFDNRVGSQLFLYREGGQLALELCELAYSN
jgi:hypothetical protein